MNASSIIRELINGLARRRRERREYRAWLNAEIEAALKEADDPNAVWYDQEDLVKGLWREQRESLLARIAARDAAASQKR